MLREQQEKALLAMKSGRNVFLSGEAGTGKSYVLRQFIEQCGKKDIIICAPTGIAALNVGGVTLHRVFRAPLAPLPYTTDGKSSSVIEKAELIVIDEISMCRADLFEYVAKSILEAEKISGIHKQVIVVGDFFQLPPVFTDKDRKTLPELSGGGFAFTAPTWKAFDFVTIVLDDVVRQSDVEFIDALNGVRCGNKSVIDWINSHTSENENADAVYLCGTNRQAEAINLRRLSSLKGREKVYNAVVEGIVSNSDKPTSDILRLKAGARVMTLVNTDDYRNGSICTVKECCSDCIVVEFDDGNEVEICFYKWEIIDYKRTTKGIEQEVIGTYSQLPVKLAYAVTMHKSQGQTYDAVNLYPDCFVAGQLYVGLSRCTSVSQLHLMRSISDADLIVSSEVVAYYENVTKSSFDELENVTKSSDIWGGKRKGSGRKSKYGKTVVMRVPAEMVDEIRKMIEERYE